MIQEIIDASGNRVVTSDLWHVIHAEWTPGANPPSFVRTIVSEHENGRQALRSGRDLKLGLVRRMKTRAKDARDQVMVRRPSAETVKVAGRISKPGTSAR